MKRSVSKSSCATGSDQKKTRGRPSNAQRLHEEIDRNKRTGARTLQSFFNPSKSLETEKAGDESTQSTPGEVLSDNLEEGDSVQVEGQATAEHDIRIALLQDDGNLRRDLTEMGRVNRVLAKELEDAKSKNAVLENELQLFKDRLDQSEKNAETIKRDLTFEIATATRKITEITSSHARQKEILKFLEKDIASREQALDFYRRQPAHIQELIRIEEEGTLTSQPLQHNLLKSMIMNVNRDKNRYSVEERDFWIDRYNHSSISQFNNLASNLNGPHRSTVQAWMGPRKAEGLGLNSEWITDAVKLYGAKVLLNENDHTSRLENVSSLKWSNQECLRLQEAEPFACMIDETAIKIVVEYSQENDMLYGWSVMPRFVVLRNIPEDFDFKGFFGRLSFQYDKRLKRENFGICNVSLNAVEIEDYRIGFAQFSEYDGYFEALQLSGKNGVIVDAVQDFPLADEHDLKTSIDTLFAEAVAINRPRATYLYSIALNPAFSGKKVLEVATIATNNRFLQSQDHCLYTYSIMKFANYLKVPVIQFVADGDSRFRHQMMLMGAYEPNNTAQIGETVVEESIHQFIAECLVAGWTVDPPTKFEFFHYFARSEELKTSSFAQKSAKKDPQLPFSPDISMNVNHYVFIRALADIFPLAAPVIGGVPRSACQDQCHWLRKLVKISLLSTKPLLFGNYPALFSHIVQLYDRGAEYGLVKSDIDVHNKSDQRSAERLISLEVEQGLDAIPWSKGTKFLFEIGRRGFEAWWKPNLTMIERISGVYFVSRSIQLWRRYLEKASHSLKEHFISEELYKDTLIMCSSLPQLAVTFKLFFKDKPFMPWNFAEYPLENYFSQIRGMFGNADEFSVLEYVARKKRVQAQQEVIQRGLVNRDRQRSQKSKWQHPKRPTEEQFPNLFDHTWSLAELLKSIYQEDITISQIFVDLGMGEELHGDSLFQIKTPEERIKMCVSTIRDDSDAFKTAVTIELPSDNQPLKLNEGLLETSEQGDRAATAIPRHLRTQPKLVDFKGKLMPIAKYVATVKQRGDMKSSGCRNVRRFILANTEESEIRIKAGLRAGSFFQTKEGHLFEIIQLKKKGRTYLEFVREDEESEIFFIAAQYITANETEYFSDPSTITKSYRSLSRIFKKEIVPTCCWVDGSTRYIKVAEEFELAVNNALLTDNVDLDISSAHCYCRRPAEFDNLVECSSSLCRINWFHYSCVGLTEATIPNGEWICPRCHGENHWCYCGNPEGRNRAALIGCENGELCKVEWFHLKCVGLYRLPEGDWFCKECLDSRDTPNAADTLRLCVCQQGAELDETIKCSNTECKILTYHKCCVKFNEATQCDWLCPSCL